MVASGGFPSICQKIQRHKIAKPVQLTTIRRGNLLHFLTFFSIFPGQKPFKCPQCPVLFSTKSNRERHLVRKHGLNVLDPATRQMMDRPFKCHLCTFSSFSTSCEFRQNSKAAVHRGPCSFLHKNRSLIVNERKLISRMKPNDATTTRSVFCGNSQEQFSPSHSSQIDLTLVRSQCVVPASVERQGRGYRRSRFETICDLNLTD